MDKEEEKKNVAAEPKENFSAIKNSEFTEKMRSNPWIVSTFALGLVLVIFLLSNFTGITGNVSKDNAAEKLITFLNTNTPSEVILKDTSSEAGLYKVNVEYQGQTIPLYVTKDGKYFIQGLTPLTDTTSTSDTQTATEVPKRDKPSVELYVFTYCPYGTQMEKAVIPAVKLLGDKINFKIRQIGAMHGEYEKVEAIRQLCIEKNYPAKFYDYLIAFDSNSNIGTCGGTATCVDPLIEKIYTQLGIDKNKINSCMSSDGEKLYSAEETNSNSKGISGSPTFVVNGVQVNVARSPDAVKTAICSAFNTAPSECSQTLSTAAAGAGFGSTTGSATASGSC